MSIIVPSRYQPWSLLMEYPPAMGSSCRTSCAALASKAPLQASTCGSRACCTHWHLQAPSLLPRRQSQFLSDASLVPSSTHHIGRVVAAIISCSSRAGLAESMLSNARSSQVRGIQTEAWASSCCVETLAYLAAFGSPILLLAAAVRQQARNGAG